MPSKPVRIDLEVITELDKLRPLSPSSYSSIIKKLLRSHQELTGIEQNAVNKVNTSTNPNKSLKSNLKKNNPTTRIKIKK